MTPERPLRLGLIGAGRWSRSYLKTVSQLPDCEIVRVARRSNRPLDPPFNHIPVTDDWRRVAEADDLDGVIIASPPTFHTEPALAALKRRLPILIEKPMTLSVPEAHTILRVAAEARVPALVEHTHLFHPAYRAIRKHFARRPIHIAGLAGNRGTFHRDFNSLWDWGAHDVAMTLALFNRKPSAVFARRLRHEQTPDGPGDLFELRLEFPCASRAHLVFGNVLTERTRRFLVRDEVEAWLYDDWQPPKLFKVPLAFELESAPLGNGEPLACDAALPLGIAVAEFCAAIRSKDASVEGVELGVSVVEVLAEAERQVGAPG